MESTSYLKLLPAVFQDPEEGGFLASFLAAWERVLSLPAAAESDGDSARHSIGALISILPELAHPRLSFLFPTTDQRFLPPLQPAAADQEPWPDLVALGRYLGCDADDCAAWLRSWLGFCASILDLDLPSEWSLDHQRCAVAELMPLYRIRGTSGGLEGWLRIALPETGEAIPPGVAIPSTELFSEPGDAEALALIHSGAADDEHLQVFFQARIRRLGEQLYGSVDDSLETLVARIRRDLSDAEQADHDEPGTSAHDTAPIEPPIPVLVPVAPPDPDAPPPWIAITDFAAEELAGFHLDRDRLDGAGSSSQRVLDGYRCQLVQVELRCDSPEAATIRPLAAYTATLIEDELPVGTRAQVRLRHPTMAVGRVRIGANSILGDTSIPYPTGATA